MAYKKLSIGYALIVTSALVTACASQPKQNAQLDQARSMVASAQGDPLASTAAADELAEATNSLTVADAAWQAGEDHVMVDHHAYLATRYAEIVKTRADDARIRQQIDNASAKTSNIVLTARTNEVQALSAELAALKAEQTERGAVLTLGDVLFDTGKASLKPGAHTTIDRLAAWLQDNPDTRVLVEGHADARGSYEYNQGLSLRRADSVAHALYNDGITPDRVNVKGLGEEYPVASNDTAAGQQQNRRVEIVISDANGAFPAAALR